MNNTPLISIITVCFHDRENLIATLKSVQETKALLPDLDYVVIDGGSDDGTMELVTTAGDLVNTFVSEPDNGTFDAMNKGIRAAKGQWVIFINAGDKIADPARFAELDLLAHTDAGLVYGNTVYGIRGEYKPYPEQSLRFGLIFACHQSMLFNKRVLKNDIFYAEKFRLVNEYDLVCRIVRKGYSTAWLDMPLAYFLGGGISSQVSWEARKARYYYVAKHYGLSGLVSTALESLGLISLPSRRA